MLAKDIMTVDPITVGPDATIEEIAQLMVGRRVSGIPVVDNGKVVGIVSEGDLMRRPETDTEPEHSWWLTIFGGHTDRSEEYLKTHGHKASQVMTSNVVTVTSETPASEIADILSHRHIKRVPVVDGGKLVGIVSRADIVRGLATHKVHIQTGATPSDTDLRETIIQAMLDAGMRGEESVNPIVSSGNVDLWGWVETEKEREATELLVRDIDGVKSVNNKLGLLDQMSRRVYWAE